MTIIRRRRRRDTRCTRCSDNILAILKKEKEPTYPKDRNYFCSRKEEDRYREKKEGENGGNGRHDNAINRDIFSGRGRVIWAGVRCQWVRARGIDGARNRSRSTDQLVGR